MLCPAFGLMLSVFLSRDTSHWGLLASRELDLLAAPQGEGLRIPGVKTGGWAQAAGCLGSLLPPPSPLAVTQMQGFKKAAFSTACQETFDPLL